MFFNNQTQKNFFTQGKFSLTSRTTTNLGNTVNYSLTPGNTVNAYNTNFTGSYQPQYQNWNQQMPQNTLSSYGNTYVPYNTQVLAQQTQGTFISGAMIQPSIDISETSSDVIVAAHVSNVNVSDVNISATENSVTITATAWLGNQNISLNRTVALPTSVRAEAIDATLQSGILEIKCPKVERLHRSRVIVKADQVDKNQPDTIIE